ncbi:MAG: PIN domain-containing protein [Gemmatales bacterium]
MLLDTSGLLCFLYESETHHDQAVTLFEQATTRYSHTLILAELLAVATVRKLDRQKCIKFIREMLTSPDIEIIEVTKSMVEQSIDFLSRRKDKQWSICDAVSFLLMREHQLTEALTNDRHFEQAGYQALLKK